MSRALNAVEDLLDVSKCAVPASVAAVALQFIKSQLLKWEYINLLGAMSKY